MVDVSRREFMVVGSSSLLSLGGDVQLQVDNGGSTDGYEFQGVADLLGPADARPDPGDPFFENKTAYAYRYETTAGDRYFIRDGDDAWTVLDDPADRAAASLVVDAPGTVTGSGAGPALIQLPTTLADAELFSSPSDGILRYEGAEQARLLTVANASVAGADTTFEVAFAINGLPPVARTETPGATGGADQPEAVVTHGKLQLEPGDELAVTLANTGGSADLDIEHLLVSI